MNSHDPRKKNCCSSEVMRCSPKKLLVGSMMTCTARLQLNTVDRFPGRSGTFLTSSLTSTLVRNKVLRRLTTPRVQQECRATSKWSFEQRTPGEARSWALRLDPLTRHLRCKTPRRICGRCLYRNWPEAVRLPGTSQGLVNTSLSSTHLAVVHDGQCNEVD